jgi:hypothetical protein
MAADGPAMIAAAVRAACLAKAPRRTVQSVAAAVAGVFAHPPATARAATAPVARVPAGTQRAASQGVDGDASAETLLAALREARSTQRRKKRERRRATRAGSAAAAPAAELAPNTAQDSEAQPAEEGTCLGLGVGGRPDLVADAALVTVAPQPPEAPPRPDATMREDGEPSLMAAPMALSPANLAALEARQQIGQQPRQIDFDGQSQRGSLQSQVVRGLLGLDAGSTQGSNAGTDAGGDAL